MRLLFLLFFVRFTSALRITCGRSFVACADETKSEIRTSARVYGVSNVPQLVRPKIPDKMVQTAALDAQREVERLLNENDARPLELRHPLSAPIAEYVRLHSVNQAAKALSVPAYVSTSMTKRLLLLGLRDVDIATGVDDNVLSGTILGRTCQNRRERANESCPPTFYRSLDGQCNNVAHSNFGAAFQPLQRLAPAAYADGVGQPRESKDGAHLPNERKISLEIFSSPREANSQVTQMAAFWLYAIGSDLAHVAPNQLIVNGQSYALPCCSNDFKHLDCDPIHILPEDPIYNLSCIPHSRTLPAEPRHCKLGQREQANEVSSYLDGSFIYGTSIDELRKRKTDGGRLITINIPTIGAYDLLPTDRQSNEFCRSQQPAPNRCFVSGTRDVNLLPGISALHTLWTRQHNRLATQLKILNRRWNDERIFEESRKILIAQLQHVTYNEFLPVLLGQESIKRYELRLKSTGFDSSYDMNLSADALNEFAVLVSALAFSLLPNQRIKLTQQFNNPDYLLQRGGFEKLVHELITNPIEKTGPKLAAEFRGEFLASHVTGLGLDLAAINLKLGRDHGLPSYVTLRRHCGFGRIYTFNDLKSEWLSAELVTKVSQIYDSVDDIDLLIGALAEKPKNGAVVGSTMACILGNQFYRTARADRFWYENFFANSAFSEKQLSEIRKFSLARLLCDVGDQSLVQPQAFLRSDSYENLVLSCTANSISKFDLAAWKDDDSSIELPINRQTLVKVVELAKFNVEERNRKEKLLVEKNQRQFQRGDPLYAYGNMMRSKAETKHFSRVADVLLESTKILAEGRTLPDGEELPRLNNELLQRLLPGVPIHEVFNNYTAFLSEYGNGVDECLPRALPCDHTSRYRHPSGWCNNLKHPEFGNAFTPLKHLMTPVYDDGFDQPRSKAKSGRTLPSARKISNTVHSDVNISHVHFTHMIMQFGQFVDHELTHSPVARSADDQILNCTRCDSPTTLSQHCMPLRVETGDPHFPTHYPNGEPRCLPFARSVLGQLNLGYRGQINQLTAFVDGSAIYGSTLCEANNLRMFRGGLMNFTNLGDVNHMALPQGGQEKDCRSLPKEMCFVAGDERNSHQPGLTMVHTFMLREHNRIAHQLSAINSHWDDERLYQETRRIHVAQFQHIVFAEFLPKIIGKNLLAEYDLLPQKDGYYKNYDDTCDAAISQPFATAAFRFGHTLVRRMFPRLDSKYQVMSDPVDLANHFGHVGPIYNRTAGGMDSMLMGLLGTPAMAFDRHITTALRNHLFARRGEPTSGMDLIAINILRARDHGVQAYNDYRPFCGLKRAQNFNDLLDIMDESSVAALRLAYEHVDDIDLFPGLVSERARPGALLGHTMSCILAEQFRRLKKCDRFFYENDNAAAKFTPAQLQEIRKIKLANLFCQNSEFMTFLQPNVFDLPDENQNAHLNCDHFERIDLEHWREKETCEINGLLIRRGETRNITPCMSCTCTMEGTECNAMKIQNCEKLLQLHDLSELQKDASCMTQCAELLNSHGKSR
ncbi:Peroxidasin [Aphelenchoides besseyi]|nr:Peroxidasin [Aphelenchoides besseyi]